MATGRLPFSGATSAVIFHAILELDPVPASQLNSAVPPRLEEILGKALEKDRDLRFHSAGDLRGDLRRLKRDIESGRKSAQVAPTGVPAIPMTGSSPAVASGISSAGRASASSDVIAAARQHKLSTGLTLGIVLALIAAAGYGIYAYFTRSRPAPFQNFTVTKVTEGGKSVLAALSPDGKYILNLVGDNGLASLWLRNMCPPTATRRLNQRPIFITTACAFLQTVITFILAVGDPGNRALKFLYRAPLLGGTPQKLISDLDSNISFSPDGQRFAFMRYDNPERGKYQLIIRMVEGGDEKVLSGGPTSDALYQPAWSPDGKNIVCQMLDVQTD